MDGFRDPGGGGGFLPIGGGGPFMEAVDMGRGPSLRPVLRRLAGDGRMEEEGAAGAWGTGRPGMEGAAPTGGRGGANGGFGADAAGSSVLYDALWSALWLEKGC